MLADVVKDVTAKNALHIDLIDADIKGIQSTLEGGVATPEELVAINTKLETLTASLKEVRDNQDNNDNSGGASKRTTWFYDFESTLIGGQPLVLRKGKYVHFSGVGTTGLPAAPIEIPPWSIVYATTARINLNSAGVFNTDTNEIALFEGSKGSNNHVLFMQSNCVVKTTMANFMLTKAQKFSVEASVGGGNDKRDGGYKIMFVL